MSKTVYDPDIYTPQSVVDLDQSVITCRFVHPAVEAEYILYSVGHHAVPSMAAAGTALVLGAVAGLSSDYSELDMAVYRTGAGIAAALAIFAFCCVWKNLQQSTPLIRNRINEAVYFGILFALHITRIGMYSSREKCQELHGNVLSGTEVKYCLNRVSLRFIPFEFFLMGPPHLRVIAGVPLLFSGMLFLFVPRPFSGEADGQANLVSGILLYAFISILFATINVLKEKRARRRFISRVHIRRQRYKVQRHKQHVDTLVNVFISDNHLRAMIKGEMSVDYAEMCTVAVTTIKDIHQWMLNQRPVDNAKFLDVLYSSLDNFLVMAPKCQLTAISGDSYVTSVRLRSPPSDSDMQTNADVLDLLRFAQQHLKIGAWLSDQYSTDFSLCVGVATGTCAGGIFDCGVIYYGLRGSAFDAAFAIALIAPPKSVVMEQRTLAVCGNAVETTSFLSQLDGSDSSGKVSPRSSAKRSVGSTPVVRSLTNPFRSKRDAEPIALPGSSEGSTVSSIDALSEPNSVISQSNVRTIFHGFVSSSKAARANEVAAQLSLTDSSSAATSTSSVHSTPPMTRDLFVLKSVADPLAPSPLASERPKEKIVLKDNDPSPSMTTSTMVSASAMTPPSFSGSATEIEGRVNMSTVAPQDRIRFLKSKASPQLLAKLSRLENQATSESASFDELLDKAGQSFLPLRFEDEAMELGYRRQAKAQARTMSAVILLMAIVSDITIFVLLVIQKEITQTPWCMITVGIPLFVVLCMLALKLILKTTIPPYFLSGVIVVNGYLLAASSRLAGRNSMAGASMSYALVLAASLMPDAAVATHWQLWCCLQLPYLLGIWDAFHIHQPFEVVLVVMIVAATSLRIVQKEWEARRGFLYYQLSNTLLEETEHEHIIHECVLDRLLPSYVVPVVANRKSETGSCIADVLEDVAALEVSISFSKTQTSCRLPMVVEELDVVDKALKSALTGCEHVRLLRVLGDRLLIAGPIQQPEASQVDALVSAVLIAQAKRRTKAVELLSDRASLELLGVLQALIASFSKSRHLDVEVTAAISRSDAAAAVLGNSQPRFELLGPVTRYCAALLDLSPAGSIVVTEAFHRAICFSEASNRSSIMDSIETAASANEVYRRFGFCDLNPMSWASANYGVMQVIPLHEVRRQE